MEDKVEALQVDDGPVAESRKLFLWESESNRFENMAQREFHFC